MFNKHWVAFSLLAALVLFVGGFVLVGDNAKQTNSRGAVAVAAVQPVSFSGTWVQAKEVDGIGMYADIADGRISIDMTDPLSGSYWQGSFDASGITDESSVLITSRSDGDPQLSQETAKTFTYDNGDLSFEFSMLGQTSIIHLQRSSE